MIEKRGNITVNHKIEINKDVLKWAIEESTIPIEQIYQKYPQINDWLAGAKTPTFIQVKNLSSYLKIPFGMFFLSQPPKQQTFNVEFRTLNNKISNNYSLELKTVIQDMDYRKSWMSEYKQINGYDKVNIPITIDFNKRDHDNAARLRTLLDIDVHWQKKVKTSYDAFKFIRSKLEAFGILVMMNGIVRDNRHRMLDVSEFRAFVLNDEFSPLIFINRNDTENGMLYSLLHEFIHILIDKTDDIFIGIDHSTEIEQKINSLVAEFLVPNNVLLNLFDRNKNPKDEIKRVSEILKVSRMVVAIKGYKLNLISQEVKDNIVEETKKYYINNKEKREEKNSGGNYYLTTQSRLSKNFYKTVIHQAEAGKLLFTEAYKLLGLKGNTYDKFKTYVVGKLYE